MPLITAYVIMVFVYSLISKRLESIVITPPILFSLAGMVLFLYNPVKVDFEKDLNTLLMLAEIGLLMTLLMMQRASTGEY